MGSLKKYLMLVLGVVLLGMVVSCVGMQRDPNSELPTNGPAAWEGKTLGVPL